MRLLRRGDSASSLDLLVVGLGNPGREYAGTATTSASWSSTSLAPRGHVVQTEVQRPIRRSPARRCEGRAAEARDLDEQVGEGGGGSRTLFKVEPDALLAVHDESDFDLGRLQMRAGGGLAGHNGLRSLASQLGTQEFLRLRISVGRPGRGDPRDLADFVLSDFEPEDGAEGLVARAADAVEALLREGLDESSAGSTRRLPRLHWSAARSLDLAVP